MSLKEKAFNISTQPDKPLYVVRLEDAEQAVVELKQKLQQVQYILNREYPRNWGLDAVDSDKLRRIRDLLEEEKERDAKP